jgi:hypothetical protein
MRDKKQKVENRAHLALSKSEVTDFCSKECKKEEEQDKRTRGMTPPQNRN